MSVYKDQDGNTVLLGVNEINTQLPKSQPCETCNYQLKNHWWIALDSNGMVVKCDREDNGPNPPRWQPNKNLDFTYYVSYNSHGGVNKLLPRHILEEAWNNFESYNQLYLNVWELRIEKVGSQLIINNIDVRLSPDYAIDGKDNQWRSWDYTFMPEHYKWKE